MQKHIFESDFKIGDRVHIDGDSSLTAVVTAVLFRSSCPQCEVSWISDNARTAWIETWRLTHEV